MKIDINTIFAMGFVFGREYPSYELSRSEIEDMHPQFSDDEIRIYQNGNEDGRIDDRFRLNWGKAI